MKRTAGDVMKDNVVKAMIPMLAAIEENDDILLGIKLIFKQDEAPGAKVLGIPLEVEFK